jgi:mycothiol system anti-sigma-R factor
VTSDESCADFLERIVYFLDNELDEADVADVRIHLDECAPCLQNYDLQRTVKALVARSCHETAPETLRQRVRIQIEQIQVRYSDS